MPLTIVLGAFGATAVGMEGSEQATNAIEASASVAVRWRFMRRGAKDESTL